MTVTDNAGKLLATLFRGAITTGTLAIVGGMKSTDGVVNGINLYGTATSTQSYFRSSFLSFMQIGKGVSVKTRQDFAIEDPFIASPENTLQPSLISGYIDGSGLVTIGVTISPTGSNGTITESIKVSQGRTTSVLTKNFCFFSDSIPPTPFLTGQNVFVEYQLQF